MPNDLSAPDVARLAACPFCGENLGTICRTQYLDTEAFAVSCRTRDCHGAVFSLGYGLFSTEAEAIAAWNTRPQATPAEALAAYEAYRAPETPHGISTADRASEITLWNAAFVAGRQSALAEAAEIARAHSSARCTMGTRIAEAILARRGRS